MQQNTIWLGRDMLGYFVSYSDGNESGAYVAKSIEGKLVPLSFGTCLSIIDGFSPEFYKRKVKVEVNRADSSLIDELEENAFRAFVRLCELSSK